MWQDCIKSVRKYLLVLCLMPALAVAVPPVQNNLFVEGQDYIRLPDKVRTNPNVEQLLMSDPHKVQVLFFFNYGCHGCEMFHTPFDVWAIKQRKAPKNKVAIYVYPVSFNAQWGLLAKLYYVAENLDPSGKLNATIFTAIHKQGLKLWDKDIAQKFFIQNGYTAVQFEQAYNSFNVNRLVKRADDISKAYGIITTPDVVINGPVHSYKLDLPKAGNNIQRLMDIINYLVLRESKLL